jgi:broad specificity phosphatase PhoE
MRACWWLSVVIALSGRLSVEAQLTVVYLRHAEGGHNVVSEFEQAGIPTNEWPAYVGNENAFTPRGEAQAGSVARDLPATGFDLIAVSPKWRTRHTILPYLKAHGLQAEVWPELGETGNVDGMETAGGVHPDLFAGRWDIRLGPDEAGFVRFRADGTGDRQLQVSNRAEAVACAAKVEELLRTRVAGDRPTRVLLVGHGNASVTLIRQLTRQPDFHAPHLKNVHVWSATRRDDGSFELGPYNTPARDLRF